MNRHVRRGVRALSATAVLTLGISLAAPSAHADDIPSTNVAEAIEDTIATGLDVIDSVSKLCEPVVREWTSVWRVPQEHTTANGSVYYLEEGGATPRIVCAGTYRLIGWIMDQTTTSPIVWPTVTGETEFMDSSGGSPTIVAQADVPYFGPDAVDVPVVDAYVDAPFIRPYGQVTVHT